MTPSDIDRLVGHSAEATLDQEHVRSVLETAPDPVIVIDEQGIICSFNAASEKAFGYSATEVIGCNVSMLMPSPDRESHDSYLAHYLQTGEARIIGIGREVTARRRDGSTFPARLAISEVRIGGQRLFTGFLQNLSAQKAAEAALEREKVQLQSILETAPDPVVVIDERGIVQSFNAASVAAFGYERDEVTGRNVSMLMPSPDRERHDSYLARYIDTNVPHIIGIGREVTARRKNGTTFPARLAISEARVGDRRLFTGFLQNLSAQKAAEEALRQETAFVTTVLATTEALVVVFDLDGRIERLNAKCEALSGTSSRNAAGKPILSFIPKAQHQLCRDALDRLLAGENPVQFQSEWGPRGGAQRVVDWSTTMISGEGFGGPHLVATGIDVTEQKRSEQALIESATRLSETQAQLYHASRHGDLGEMASAIAHELNQPLTAILNYVQASRDMLEATSADFPQKVRDFLERTAVQADRAGLIIRRLRQLYERGDADAVLDNLNEAIEEALDLALLGVKENGIEVRLEMAPDLADVFMDRQQIQQVIINLVRNAMEAMAMADVEQRELVICTQVIDDEEVELTVADTGPGLPPEIAANLFAPFQTTKPSGMGLGLSICRSIIEAHGGRIWCTDTLGGGTTFHFTLTSGRGDL